MALQFDLSSFANNADRELLKRIPRRVASYYLALPLASEGGRVTVVTAYPENTAALHVLERLLNAEIVPVTSSELALQEAIAGIYAESAPTAQSILAWTDDPAWYEAVVLTAQDFGRTLDHGVHILDSALSIGDVIAAAGRQDAALLVTHVSNPASLSRLVHQSATALLLVRGEYAPIGQLLITLRGYGSDHQALERVLPIIVRENALATVLPLTRSTSSHLNELLAGDSPARQHLQAFLHELDRQDIQVTVRLRPGEPVSQIVMELAQGTYGLLVIAAEAEGQFVWQVLSRIDNEQVWPGRPVLIVKPPVGAVPHAD
jgi:hypothetical protein